MVTCLALFVLNIFWLLMQGLEVVQPSLELLKTKVDMVNHPVWANADIVNGPGSSSDPIDAQECVSLRGEP